MDNNQEVHYYEVDSAQQIGVNSGKKQSWFCGWKKGVIIFLLILVLVIILGVACTQGAKSLLSSNGDNVTIDADGKYIGELHVEGTISEASSGSLLEDSSYDQAFLINSINYMIEDDDNTGIILFVNTPGGSVYASDELYLKIKEYKEKTGRPVFSYMGSMAASGGYYVSAGCDKIIANRNCWTGSIGVTIGTIYNVSEFLDKLGVKTVTITSGKNKAMGGSTDELTTEQIKIFQGLVDEAYDQFVGIVAEGRNMKISTVEKLADGRIYTAKQAKANGLIDSIMSFDEAVALMKNENNLADSEIVNLYPSSEETLADLLLGKIFGKGTSADSVSQYDELKILLGENNKFTVTYMSNIQK